MLLVFIVVYLLLLALFLTLAVLMRKQAARPHVIVIMADDLGWGDVQWTDPDMRTPALSALLESGVLVNNSYVHPMDSPSRAAFFTGLGFRYRHKSCLIIMAIVITITILLISGRSQSASFLLYCSVLCELE